MAAPGMLPALWMSHITQIIAHQILGTSTYSCVWGALSPAVTIQQQIGGAKPKEETFLLRLVLTLWRGWEGETGEPEVCEVRWRYGLFSRSSRRSKLDML